ncbi:phosphatase PAP2 family protein [Candidatus Uhrbacteria bacterium]|nr:phosphatase PAP2 family protein [Candidatus Uhrbacteria bacterium]
MNTDERWSRWLFDFGRKTRATKQMAIFCASFLIWLMLGFAIGSTFPDMRTLIPVVLLPWGVALFLSEWIRRPRPFRDEHYRPIIQLAIQTPSFPSQHTTIAFSLVVLFLNQPLVWPVMLVAAVLVALGRLSVGVHYVSDVIIGALIGFGLAYAMNLAAQLFFVIK